MAPTALTAPRMPRWFLRPPALAIATAPVALPPPSARHVGARAPRLPWEWPQQPLAALCMQRRCMRSSLASVSGPPASCHFFACHDGACVLRSVSAPLASCCLPHAQWCTRSSLAIVLARAASFGPSHATTTHALPFVIASAPAASCCFSHASTVLALPAYHSNGPSSLPPPVPHATTVHAPFARQSIGVRSPPARHSNRSSSPAAIHTPRWCLRSSLAIARPQQHLTRSPHVHDGVHVLRSTATAPAAYRRSRTPRR